MMSKQKKDLKNSVAYYSKAKELLAKDSAVSISMANINDSLGIIYTDLQELYKADTSFSASLKIRELLFGRNSLEYASGCYNLGVLYCRYLARYKESEILLENARNIRGMKLGKTSLDYAQSCHYLATAKLGLNKRDEALNLYIEAKDIKELRLGKYDIEYAKTLANIGNVYNARSDYRKALQYYSEARQIFDSVAGRNSGFSMKCIINIAGAHRDLSQYYEARNILLEYTDTIQEIFGIKSLEYRGAIGTLGQIYQEIGEYQLAEQYFFIAMKLDTAFSGKNSEYYAATCWNIGTNYFRIGQYHNAEKYFLQSKNIREKIVGKNNMAYAATCESLAMVYMSTGNFEKVEALLLETKASREAVAGNNFSNYYLGQYYNVTGQPEKALSILQDGKKILETNKLTNTEYYLGTVESLAITYMRLNRLPESKPLLALSEGLVEKLYGPGHMRYAMIQKYFGEAFWMEGKYDSAYLCYQKAIVIYNNEQKKVFRFTNEEEKTAYLKMIAGFQNSLLSFNYQVMSAPWQGMVYDFISNNRNLTQSSFENLKQHYFNTNDTALRSVFNQWSDARKEVSYWNSLPIGKRPPELQEMEVNASRLEKELTATYYNNDNISMEKLISWKTIRDQLNVGEAAIEFASFRYIDPISISDSLFYFAMILRKDSREPQMVRLFEERQLDKLLQEEGGTEMMNRINNLYTNSNSLYQLVWEPIEKYLKGVQNIYYAATGNLHKISFASMKTNGENVLIDKYMLNRLNSTYGILENSTGKISDSEQIQLYGGISYAAEFNTSKQGNNAPQSSNKPDASLFPEDVTRGTGFQFLPGTKLEVDQIKKEIKGRNYKVNLLAGADATEGSFKSLSGSNSPGILHVATHGYFFPDPKLDKVDFLSQQFEKSGITFKRAENPLLRSGLLFSGANFAWQGKQVISGEDGILTAYEISNLYFPNTKLIVLSACETGLGDIQGNEGVYGLQRAFKMAGARYLLMSLWKVPDKETSEFMHLFYKNLFLKKDIYIAFNGTQKEIRKRYPDNPYKWAAWILLK